eukprot:m.101140 g.101140  ORF g.101140 m.101140 type:complete len:269 (+) comp27305_c0_seq2:80-886(+)
MNFAEDTADLVIRKGGVYLKPIARFLLLSTFVEDGIRMFHQWGEQTSYIKHTWKVGAIMAALFVLFNLIFQLIPSGIILFMRDEKQKKFIKIAIFCLASVMVVQTLAYSVLWNYHFFARNFAVGGSLLLLFAEVSEDKKNHFAGVPEMGGNKQMALLQLSGRTLLVVMFLTLMQFDSIVRIILEVTGLVLVLCVAVGKFTKVAALSLVTLLLLQNTVLNDFWNEYSNSAKFDFKKYDFFQTMSVIGGLLMVVALGPGGLSIDNRKKDF